MLNIKKYIFLFICLLFILPLSAEEKARSKSINSKCLSCHGIESNSEVRRKINEKYFFGSIHALLKCTDCHRVTLRNNESNIHHEKDLPGVNCIAACHKEDKKTRPGLSPLYYSDSVHGKAFLERRIQDVAKCWDCHGKHNIKKASDLKSRANRRNIPKICSVCHNNFNIIFKYHTHSKKPYQEYMQSAHGKALYKEGLLNFAAICTDCHGVHNIKGVDELGFMAKKPETCGRCHVLIYIEYRESIHAREALDGNTSAPFCVDCHGEHKIISPLNDEAPTSLKNVSDTCSACHARPEIMRKFGIPEAQIESFIRSSHQIRIGLGNKAVANCTSCHGFHDIRPANDPLSRINRDNLSKTCGQENCHPEINEKMIGSKIHIDISSKKPRLPYHVQQLLSLIIFAIALIIIVWLVPGFMGKIKYLKR